MNINYLSRYIYFVVLFEDVVSFKLQNYLFFFKSVKKPPLAATIVHSFRISRRGIFTHPKE